MPHGYRAHSRAVNQYDEGFFRHAGAETLPPRDLPFVGAWAANNTAFSASLPSWAKLSYMPLRVIFRKPSASGRSSLPRGEGGHAREQRAGGFAGIRRCVRIIR